MSNYWDKFGLNKPTDLPPISAISVTFASAGGVMALPVEGGEYIVVRFFRPGGVLFVDAVEDGLLLEARAGRTPIPWRSAFERKAAFLHIRDDRPDLSDEERDLLLAHIRKSGAFALQTEKAPA